MDKIAVLDFGGQYAHLIANRIRRFGVYSEILDPSTSIEVLKNYKAIILSGGPASVNAPEAIKCDKKIFDIGIPILSICYGHQLVASMLGGKVENGIVPEYGHTSIEFSEKKGIFKDVKTFENVWMSHFDQITEVPEGFKIIAKSKDCPIVGMVNYERNIYSIQFHPEVTHTKCGDSILENFVELSAAKKSWSIDKYIKDISDLISQKVGDKKVFLMISGGVDSTVAFLLLSKVLGPENVYGLFVDTGLMRLNEGDEVCELLKEVGVENLHVYDASDEYFEALKSVYDPEEKRKIIGNLFLNIKDKVSSDLGLNPDEWILGQGTIYPDTIESGESKYADKIKTHHNRIDRIQELCKQGKVIEPLAQLYKDEVRMLGEKLGLDSKMVWRHPFPGPGLGVRILCSTGNDELDNVEVLNEKIHHIVRKYELYGKVLPIKSVGVQGDERTYKHPVLIYGKRASWDDLNDLSTILTNQFPEINRVVYGLNTGLVKSLTSQDVFVSRDRVLTTQKADKIVMDYIYDNKMDRDIWQCPTVLIPVKVNDSEYESIVLRPVESTEAMTANFYHMNWLHIEKLTKKLIGLKCLSGVFYDITNKPPGTIEWE